MLGNLKDEFKEQDFEKLNLNDLDELELYILHRIFHINNSIKNNLKIYNFHKMYKELLNFCTLDLSSFYFDIRKDVLYCDSLTSKKRKNCVIVLNIILESLLKWFAPILVFTTDEIFSLINNAGKNIHEHTFVNVPKNWENKKLNEKWEQLFKIKQEANIAIETKRASKEIGSSLEAEITLSVDKKRFELMGDLDLAEYFITSKAEKVLSEDSGIKIEVSKAKGIKCPRCWKIAEKNCERCSDLI
jgi:isoleucyl-tRNA synthetase